MLDEHHNAQECSSVSEQFLKKEVSEQFLNKTTITSRHTFCQSPFFGDLLVNCHTCLGVAEHCKNQ